jgi:hypothetical protein
MALFEGIKIDGNVIGSALGGIGTLAKDIRTAITGKDPAKLAEIEMKLLEIENQGLLAQAEINKIEAASGSLFVSGWRPAAGWCCVCGLYYTFILQPLLAWCAVNYKFAVPPTIDMNVLMQLLFGMLGLAGLRSYEKVKGASRS